MFPLRQPPGDRKTINVNAASIIDLKTELLRKQDQIRLKSSVTVASTSSSSGIGDGHLYDKVAANTSRLSKKIQGVMLANNDSLRVAATKQARKDTKEAKETRAALTQVEIKVLARSREMLEKKERLYDQMKKGLVMVDPDGSEDLLVNFEEKARLGLGVASFEDSDSDDEKYNDMIEIVDEFGRNRVVPKRDLHLYVAKKKDDDDEDYQHRKTNVSDKGEDDSDHMSQEREHHQSWEDQAEAEAVASSKRNVYYQDVQAGEVRDHGAAYYALSADDDTRAQQLAMFDALHKETEAKKAERNRIKAKRSQMLKARLAKVAARKGIELPEAKEDVEKEKEDSDEEDDDVVGPKPEISIHKANERMKAESSCEKDRQTIKIRDWDIGKDGLYTAAYSRRNVSRTTFDQAYAERMRDERNRRFAPPVSYDREAKRTSTSIEQDLKRPKVSSSHSDDDDEDYPTGDPLYNASFFIDDKLAEIRRQN